MVDREKVIKGLKCCMSGQLEGLGCDRVPCPYNDIEDCEGALHYDALALLELYEQHKTQKKSKRYNDMDWSGAQGNDDIERLKEQAKRSEWGIYG